MSFQTVIDQLGEEVTFSFPPQRIVSLVPSQSEFLASLQLDEQVSGITEFCIHPSHWHREKMHVGGTKKFNFDVIDSLQPDLIIGNKEENYREGIVKLKEKYPVWVSDILNLNDALQMMVSIGHITDRMHKAVSIVETIRLSFEKPEKLQAKSVLYLIWRKPWMAAGKNTFIDDMLTRNGLINVISETRYPELSIEMITSLKPDYIFLSSEPFPFKQKHILEINGLSPNSRTILVDGEMFSWYGSRLIYASDYFQKLQL